MRDCPKCGDPVTTDGVCTGCGWRPKGAKTAAAPVDLDAMRCAWLAGPERCHYAGTMSPNTSGGGPWYCSGHYACDDAVHGQRIVDESRRVMYGKSLTGSSVKDAAKRTFLARPIPPVPPTHPGVRYPKGSGMFQRISKVLERCAPRREEAAERAAIQAEA